MLYYPDNTLTRYTTRLANAVSLTGEWEVGLVEIQYQHSWQNLERNEGRIIYSQLIEVGEAPPGYINQSLALSGGYYNSNEHLVRAINGCIKEAVDEHELDECPLFRLNSITKRLIGTINYGADMLFSPALCAMLGIDESQNPIQNLAVNSKPLQWTAAHACDINRGFSALYVYCSVLEHVIVGDTKAPLLRIVRVSGKSGDNVHTIYEKPHYVPLQQKSFDSIEIDIRSDVGNPIPFENGRVIAILHFRRCKLPYLLQ